MKKTLITAMVTLCLALGVCNMSSAQQAGPGNGPGSGWNCTYRAAVNSDNAPQATNRWYCPRSGEWTNTRNHYGPMHSGNGHGYGWMHQNQTANNK